jgi:lysophospholipase L1-like esterase
VALQGQDLTGNAYIFVSPESGVRRVRFYLDDPGRASPVRTEGLAPYDFAGTANSGAALPFDPTSLDPAVAHTVGAEVERIDGSVEVITASFGVGSSPVVLPFSQNFENGAAINDWTVVDDSGVASNWQVTGGALRQDNLVAGIQQSYHLGTYAFLNGYFGLTDYTVSASFTPLPDAPPNDRSDGREVGMLFRYADSRNYYRISVNARLGQMRLEKRVDGQFVPLRVNSQGYIDGESFTLSVVLLGEQIHVLRDGIPVFALLDSSIGSGTVALYSQDAAEFDDVSIDEVASPPLVTIEGPLADSVQTSNSVVISALTTNLDGGSLDLRIDGAQCLPVQESPVGSNRFTADCGNQPTGLREIAARLVGSSALPAPEDRNANVGVGGRSIISAGDSLVAGTGDNRSSDNRSPDGAMIASQGFQTPLREILIDPSTPGAVPTIVFNEGIPGDQVTGLLSRIESILDRHDSAEDVLIQIGTNDAGLVPTSPSVFQTNLQGVIDAVVARGKTAWIALLPPAFAPDGSLSSIKTNSILGYNNLIGSGALSDANLGPDLYGYFYDDGGTTSDPSDDLNRFDLYSLDDGLHYNALGYRAVAQLWANVLSGTTIEPFVLDGLCNLGAPAPTSGNFELLLSASPTRSGPVALEGQDLTGVTSAYIFVWPETAVRQVRFYLDGSTTPIQVEGLPPFDFAGTATDGTAQAFNPTGLNPGVAHTVRAEVERTDGGVEEVVASFRIASACSGPTNLKQNLLDVGNRAYVDSPAFLSSIPAQLGEGIWIMTAAADYSVTGMEYLRFDVDRPVSVYVAYDSSASSLPQWLAPASGSGFQSVGESIDLADQGGAVATLDLYRRSFSAGQITLGGNHAADAGGLTPNSGLNYLVVVVPE